MYTFLACSNIAIDSFIPESSRWHEDFKCVLKHPLKNYL
jgi:hypothetical protein